MKTYFEYSDAERANLTEQQIQAMLDVELMSSGVLKPSAPKFTPVILPEAIGKRRVYYGVQAKGKYGSDEDTAVVFDTSEKASAFIALGPMLQDYNYEAGADYRYVQPLREPKICVHELFTFEDVNAVLSELKKNKAATQANEKAQSEYQRDLQAVEKITQDVWSDWFKQREQLGRCQEVIKTYEQYLVLTSGNSELALTFLEKAYKSDMLKTTREWLPDQLPDFARPPAAKEEAA